MNYPTRCSGSVICLFILCVFASSAVPVSAAARKPSGNYHDSPVFYELFCEEYSDTINLTLLPKQKLYIAPFGIKDVDHSSWYDPQTTDLSWWMQVESLKFLLPLIKSQDPVHRSLARSWLEGWFGTHYEVAAPNRAAWDRMTAAVRAMVFVFYLKEEEMSSQGSSEVIEILLREIELHQKFLCRKEEFSFNSNHGLIEAMGLLETTRVYPDSLAEEIGRSRLESIVTRSVSQKGIHMEHSCGYHFYFMNWLLDYILYMNSQERMRKLGCEALEIIGEKMKRAAYYMQDHDGNIPPIGDTDPHKVADVLSYDTAGEPAKFCFDGEAGYAIYKDDAASPARRYVIFNIQNVEPAMPYHYHNDALAVYLSSDGETILGDQGRYEYGVSGRRKYFISPSAHNTILPLSRLALKAEGGKRKLVNSAWWNEAESELSFGAQLAYPKCSARRCITIPESEWPVIISDTLSGTVPMVLLWNIGSDVTHIVSHEVGQEDGMNHEWILHTKKNNEFLLSVIVAEQGAHKKHSAELLKGSSKPFIGWCAPAYKKCVPSSVIMITLHPAGSIFVTTRIQNIN